MNGGSVQANGGSVYPDLPPPPITGLDSNWFKIEYEFEPDVFVTDYPPFRIKCQDGLPIYGIANSTWVFDTSAYERYAPGVMSGFTGAQFTHFGLLVGRGGGDPELPIDFQFEEIRIVDRRPYVPTVD